jgi:hypothetical protein
LHFTRELSDEELTIFDKTMKTWFIEKHSNGRYYSTKPEPKGWLFTWINEVRRKKQSIADALDKLIVHYGEYEDDLYEEWKEKGKI